MSKKIMREFIMEEISSVDRPAQKGARMTIMKRDNVTPDNINKQKDNNMSEKTLEEVTKNLETLNKALEDTKAELAKANILAAMSDEEKAAMLKMDDKAKTDWLAMSSEDRKKKLAETKKNDEVIELHGQTISKRDVGDALFSVMKSQAEEIRKANERLEAAEKATAFAKFEKRASEELKNLPGTSAEKANILAFVSKADADVLKNIEAVLKAANSALDPAFNVIGKKNTVEEGSNEDKLNKYAAEFRKADPKLTEHQALDKAYRAYPELVEV